MRSPPGRYARVSPTAETMAKLRPERGDRPDLYCRAGSVKTGGELRNDVAVYVYFTVTLMVLDDSLGE